MEKFLKYVFTCLANFLLAGYKSHEGNDKALLGLIKLTSVVFIVSLLGSFLLFNTATKSKGFDGLFIGALSVIVFESIFCFSFILLLILKIWCCGFKESIIAIVMLLVIVVLGIGIHMELINPIAREIKTKIALDKMAKGEKLSSNIYVNAKNMSYVIHLPDGITEIPRDIQCFYPSDERAKGTLVIPNTVTTISSEALMYLDNYDCIELPDYFTYIQSVDDIYIGIPKLNSLEKIVWRKQIYTDASILQNDLIESGIQFPHNVLLKSRMDNNDKLSNIPLKLDLLNYEGKHLDVSYYPYINMVVILDENSFKNGECIVSLGLPSNFSFVANPHFDMKIFPNLKEIVYEDMHYQIHNREEYYALLQVLRNNSIDVPDDFILGLEFQ